jgi:acyl-CoA thioester hydrolase
MGAMTDESDDGSRSAPRRRVAAAGLAPGEGIAFPVRVRYFETDQMGIVHHANYAVWFEAARSEYCRVHGIDYRGMEANGLALPVLELSVRYLSAAHYEDELTIRAKVVECRRSLLRIRYAVEREGKTLATGETLQMLIERSSGRSRSFTPELAARFLARSLPS